MDKETPSFSSERLQHEYSELNQNHRHYSALRFASLTLLFATLAGLATAAFGKEFKDDTIRLTAKFGGLVMTLVFFVYEYRTSTYIRHFRHKLTEIEKALGYSHMSTLPTTRPFLRAHYATLILFCLIAILWLVTLATHVCSLVVRYFVVR